MSRDHDAEYVKNELLEMVTAAMDAGFAEYVGFDVTDGELAAETYDPDGDVKTRWVIEITPRAVGDNL